MKAWFTLLAALLLATLGCNRGGDQTTLPPIPFTPYSIQDSSRLDTTVTGLVIYKVLEGPGPLSLNGEQVRLHYHGMLRDGKVFDSSWQRGEPFTMVVGAGKVIEGLDEGVRRLRQGSKAILFIPPTLGYGDKAEKDIPANSELIFHVEILGPF